MKAVVIASTRRSSGKTSMVLGLAGALKKRCGYIKPFGDRLLYRKKRLWDYDAALVCHVFGLSEEAGSATIGFERAKLRYMYTPDALVAKLQELAATAGADKELLFVEASSDLSAGVSVGLDALSLARALKARLLVVVADGEDAVVDDIAFLCRSVDMSGVDFAGVVINKVRDLEEFKTTHIPELERLGVKVLGVLPHVPELSEVSVRYVADMLFARVVAGERGLDARVKAVFVGAMSADAAMRYPAFQQPGKLLITSGDRADIVLAALESNTAGIVLAHNLLPPPNVLSKASERGVPLLLVPVDTFHAAKQVDDLEPLITREEGDKVARLQELVASHFDLSAL